MNKASSLLLLSRLSAISRHIPDIGDSSYKALQEKNLINLTIFLNVLWIRGFSCAFIFLVNFDH